MIKVLTLTCFIILVYVSPMFAQTVEGYVYDEQGNGLPHAHVMVQQSKTGVTTNEQGKYRMVNVPEGELTVVTSFMGYEKSYKQVKVTDGETIELNFHLNLDAALLNEVEVFGNRYKQPDKMSAITRMPLRPSEQIQSISVISDKMILEQGVQTITEAVQNIPGVTLFGSYGGVRESMSIRGYRGVPVLKNGVRIDSDFRTGSALTEMQGVESVQVIKGTAAITQGLGNDLGSGGGVINVVTKTPKFREEGLVSLRSGSWGYVSPSFDFQGLLNKQKSMAFRLNGTFQRAGNYRPVVQSNRVYINPSVEWRPDETTSVILELDYMNDNRTPHTSTVNLAGNDEEAFYEMPYEKFLGFRGDNVNNKTTTYAIRANKLLNDYFSLSAAYYGASYNADNTSTSVAMVIGNDFARRRRTISRSLRDDQNATFQLDLIGRDIYTGDFKHTFQAGFDYKVNSLSTTSFGSAVMDTINVLADAINNEAGNISLSPQNPVTSSSSAYGILGQHVLSYKEFLKVIMGLRYSYGLTINGSGAGHIPGDAWNPMAGLMVSPVKNVNFFASYATTTSLRSAANRLSNGEQIGPSVTRQKETGIKSDWLDNKLRFNFTYFDIITENLSNSEYVEGTNQTTGYYYKAGDLKRNGIEVEISGRPAENLQLILGYAYLNARYEKSPSYVEGSSPINAPEHTANGWLYYTLNSTALKGLSVGVGSYYVGNRPSNDYSLQPDGHGTPVGVKPFDMPAYTTTNLQVAYPAGRFTVRAFLNNVFDNVGYNAYFRGGFINQIDPRNMACVLSYRF